MYIEVHWIKSKDIKFLGFTSLDRMGRVFEYNGCIYRGIYEDKVQEVREMFECGLITELIKQNLLIDTIVSDFKSEDFPLILKHKRITATLPTEWTATMMKDVAIKILRTNQFCQKYGYELWDGHPYNVSFDNNIPYWIDFGSIVKRENKKWRAFDEFVNYTLVPYVLMAKGDLLEAYSILLSELRIKIVTKPFRETLIFQRFLDLIGGSEIDLNDLIITEPWIEDFSTQAVYSKSFWADYQLDQDSLKADLVQHANNRFKRFFLLADLIAKYTKGAKSLVDLAGNMGIASLIIQQNCTQIQKYINTDYDYNAVDSSYIFCKQNLSFNFETYVLNFMLPMNPDVNRILKSDIVLALAITHHLLLTQGYKIDEILFKIKSFSKKYVFIEFMPLGLWAGDENSKPDIPSWYSLEFFEKYFKRHFKILNKTVLESHNICGVNEPHRVLFIGKLR